MIKITFAQINDLDRIQYLEEVGLNDEITAGNSAYLIGQSFTRQQLSYLLNNKQIVVARDIQSSQILAYAICTSWSFYQQANIYGYLEKKLPRYRLNNKKSCLFGPIWVSPSHRGNGLFIKLFDFTAMHFASKFEDLVAFIAEENQLSFAVHTTKAKMQVIDYFDFESRGYYLLSKSLYT